ncbi:MAG: exosortase [Bryobacteraceae bacterium]
MLLLVVCYYPVLARLVHQWDNDEDMGHGFFVPLMAGYIAWLKRDELLAASPRPAAWGLALVGWAAVQLMLGTMGAEIFLQRTAFVLAVIGSVAFAGGAGAVRTLAFPLFLLFFMVPIPAIIYNRITFPLQLLASRLAEIALMILGTPVLREGNVLELAGQKLQVVEACSGIRSLLSLSFLSLVYGYFFDTNRAMRVFLLASTIPIAVLANASRVTVTGILGDFDPELSRGFFHGASGWVIFVVALAMLAGLHQGLRRFHRYVYGPRN